MQRLIFSVAENKAQHNFFLSPFYLSPYSINKKSAASGGREPKESALFLFIPKRKRVCSMNLISLVVVLAIFGVVLYVVETLIPMDIRIKRLIEIIVVLCMIIYILQQLGITGGPAIKLR